MYIICHLRKILKMLYELLAGVVTFLILMYAFAKYLIWSKTEILKPIAVASKFAAPAPLSDSYKVVRFQVVYNAAQAGIDVSSLMP